MKELEISVYGEVGDEGLTVDKIRQTLKYLRKQDIERLVVRVLSYGGVVQESNGIIAAFNEYKKETGVEIIFVNDCYLASAGLNIAVEVADKLLGVPRSVFLAHRAWTIAAVNSEEAKELSGKLEEMTEPSIQAIINKTGKTREEVLALMDEERWLSIEESIDYGLVDGVYEGKIDVELANEVKINEESDEKAMKAKTKLEEELKIMQTAERIKLL